MKRKERVVTKVEIEFFKKALMKEEKSENTIHKYICDIHKFEKFMAGKKVTKEEVLKFKTELEECGKYKISSINSFLVVFNKFCKTMGWTDLCVKTIKVQQTTFETEEKELTKEEYQKLVQTALSCGDEQIALVMQTLGSSGIRISELKYIHVACLETGEVNINNKGKMRRVFLPSGLTKALNTYVQKKRIRSGIIFYNRNGLPLCRKSIWRRMKRIAKAAGVAQSKVFPHNFRHLFAKEFYKQTRDIMKLADILGHSNVNTTRIYIRTSGREHKMQLEQMNMVLSGFVTLEAVKPESGRLNDSGCTKEVLAGDIISIM